MFALNIYKIVQTYQNMKSFLANAKSVPYSTESVLRMIPGKRKKNNALLYEKSVSIATCCLSLFQLLLQ
jgi:hypothetical protein